MLWSKDCSSSFVFMQKISELPTGSIPEYKAWGTIFTYCNSWKNFARSACTSLSILLLTGQYWVVSLLTGYIYPLTKASSEHDVLCTGTWYIRSFDTCYTGWVKKTDTFAANLNNKGISFFYSPCIIINNWYTVYSLANNELIDSKPGYYNFALF
jgi:hypothetical protein